MNCYRMFTDLQEALAGGRALDDARKSLHDLYELMFLNERTPVF